MDAKTPDKYRKLLEAERYEVLFNEHTERPFSSDLNAEKRPGTFVCAACHAPLFVTNSKFNSGTGWPSFFHPMDLGGIGIKLDTTLRLTRTEYHCTRCGGHQGHVFPDGPQPTGLRYCNNGLSLKFIPQEEPLPKLR